MNENEINGQEPQGNRASMPQQTNSANEGQYLQNQTQNQFQQQPANPVQPGSEITSIDSSQQPPQPTTFDQPKKRDSGALSFIATIVAAFALVFVVNTFFFQSYKVFGSSMYPTLHDGDRLIISKVGRTGARIQRKNYVPKRGDVIVFVDPLDPSLQLIKRVIGLPGERVVLKDGALTVFNTEHPSGFNPDAAEYGKNLPKSSGATDVLVPEGHLFVSGDNREGSNSLDSRNELGTVPEELIIGTLKIRIFPFNTAQFF